VGGLMVSSYEVQVGGLMVSSYECMVGSSGWVG
jgi:hypothetical protein